MPGKIFVNYRRDDVPGDARGVRDGLAAKFGKANVFMDVDNLLVGQRFDVELAKALDACDILIAVIGPRWMDLLKERTATAERDYVREEIAAALARKITVIPVRVGREGSMPALPRASDLTEDIRDLVLHQKLDVAHERFGRDITELVEGIVAVRKALVAGERPGRPTAVPWSWVGAGAMAVLAIGYVSAAQLGVPVPWPAGPATRATDDASRAAEAARVKAAADRLAEAEAKLAAEQKARADAEARAKQLADAAEKARRDQEARDKAARDEATRKKSEEDARARAAAEAEAKRKAEEDTRTRAAAAETKRLADLAAAEERRKAQELSPGRVFRDCNDGCPEMVVVPAGRFKMGEGSSARDVTIQQAFGVGKFEVTFDEWAACVTGGGCTSNRSPNDRSWGKGRRPVINVSWNDAKEYVGWLSRRTGQTYRLLTEAEWEYAARAGTTTAYSWGDAIGRGNANCDGCGSQWDNKQTASVGSFKPNDFGLHDMHGNVWEWCEDASGSSSRVLRGGSWGIYPNFLRSANRVINSPDYRGIVIGFRVARTL